MVSFQRPGDAAVARTKYDGKIVDGSACTRSYLPCCLPFLIISLIYHNALGRPLKIEVVVDEALPTVTTPPQTQMPSLLYRLGEKALTSRVSGALTPIPTCVSRIIFHSLNLVLTSFAHLFRQPRAQQKLHRVIPPPTLTTGAVPTKRRYKKGPKRIKKQYVQTTRDQLDKEMEDYRAAADTLGL
jgi:THO complex subunit 4